jgi:hypothetical protein
MTPRSTSKPSQTLLRGLTDLHKILTAIIRAALTDHALATGLEGRIGEMQASVGQSNQAPTDRKRCDGRA